MELIATQVAAPVVWSLTVSVTMEHVYGAVCLDSMDRFALFYVLIIA